MNVAQVPACHNPCSAPAASVAGAFASSAVGSCVATHPTLPGLCGRVRAVWLSFVLLFVMGGSVSAAPQVKSPAVVAPAASAVIVLNDTGITQCTNGSAIVACDTASTGDASAHPRQDGRFGRDPAAPVKVGGGAAGFDFTKVCMDGTLNCVSAADTTESPASASAWACTKDNVTNLVWSLHSGAGDWTTYAGSTLPTAYNAQGRCGYNTGWRLPTVPELFSIVNYSRRAPSIDVAYFPGTRATFYWTSQTFKLDAAGAWWVGFAEGDSSVFGMATTNAVRLVRSAQ